MRKLRRLAAAATITTMAAVVGIGTIPAANAGLEEPAAPPVAYTTIQASLLVSCRLATVDLTTGVTTPLPDAGSADACVTDLAVAPDGSVWGIRSERAEIGAFLVHFDPATGAVLSSEAFTGDFSSSGGADGGLAFDTAGTLYAQIVTDEPGCDNDAVCLYTVDPATAAATFVGNPGDDNFFTTMYALAASCAGDMVTTESLRDMSTDAAWSDVDPQEIFAARLDFVDAATGIVTDGPDFPENFLLAGLDYERVSGVLYALGTFELLGAEDTSTTTAAEADVQPAVFAGAIYTVDPSTAELTLVAPISDEQINLETLGIAGSCAQPEPVPAPIVLSPTFTG